MRFAVKFKISQHVSIHSVYVAHNSWLHTMIALSAHSIILDHFCHFRSLLVPSVGFYITGNLLKTFYNTLMSNDITEGFVKAGTACNVGKKDCEFTLWGWHSGNAMLQRSRWWAQPTLLHIIVWTRDFFPWTDFFIQHPHTPMSTGDMSPFSNRLMVACHCSMAVRTCLSVSAERLLYKSEAMTSSHLQKDSLTSWTGQFLFCDVFPHNSNRTLCSILREYGHLSGNLLFSFFIPPFLPSASREQKLLLWQTV